MRGKSRRLLLCAAWITVPLSFVFALAAMVWPAIPVAQATASMPLSAMSVPFGGTPAVGALFRVSNGRLGAHFCTASVVHSPAGNMVLTAAHCVQGHSGSGSPGIAFVPGYDNGAAPLGVWMVTRVFVDADWAATADPDDDFAFLAVAQPGRGTPIESVTGAEVLGIDQPSAGLVRVIGYPDAQDVPIICQNRTSKLSATQTQFDCDNFTTGTSGGPFLVGTGPGGANMVVGVIGGYQRGGDTANISYAAVFGPQVQALYDTSVSQD